MTLKCDRWPVSYLGGMHNYPIMRSMSKENVITQSAVCQGLLKTRRHIESREDPGNEVAGLRFQDYRILTCDQAYFSLDMVGKGTPDTIS